MQMPFSLESRGAHRDASTGTLAASNSLVLASDVVTGIRRWLMRQTSAGPRYRSLRSAGFSQIEFEPLPKGGGLFCPAGTVGFSTRFAAHL
jgi:hypothetical protein